MEHIAFQQRSVEQLLEQFKKLWRTGEASREITFKAPTGSGKTFMTESFICELCRQPDWQGDVAFVWATFSDELAMQSRSKFMDYFYPNLPGRLLTVADFSAGALRRNDVLFLNWQKLVSRRAEDRVLRRPDDERLRKESGLYFEDVVEMTHAEGREIVLIIDESHTHVSDAARRDVIAPLHPRIILNVSATPQHEPSASDVLNGRAGYVEVPREDVVAEGMIKEQLICQTEDELTRHSGEDLDALLLTLAMERRELLAKQIAEFGLDVNPLVLIQLPNDDKASDDLGVKRKELVVREFLAARGVKEEHIACWFDGRTENMDGITRNDAPQQYMLFKQAAGTGWDCPRAQVLVMFREITSPTFHTQVVGRVLRVPVRGQQGSSIFRTAYLYTNYRRNEVTVPDQTEKNKPKTFIAHNRLGSFEPDHKLLSDFIPRVDYGDLGNVVAFQQCLMKEFDSFFSITDKHFDELRETMERSGLPLHAELTRDIMVNAVLEDFDQLETELAMRGADADYRVSRNDVEKIFTALCAKLLREQTSEETHIGNVARSWSPLKTSLRLWLKRALPHMDDDCHYRIFICDTERGEASLFRRALVRTLTAYRPLLDEQRRKRATAGAERQSEVFRFLDTYAYTEDYEALSMQRSLLTPFYLRRNYPGRGTELPFAQYLDKREDVEWWAKNGDSGKDHFAIKYTNEESGREELFYPDWLVKFKDGTLGIYDTKGGMTAAAPETRHKAEALQRRITQLNGYNRESIRYDGGIVIRENGMWYINRKRSYSYRPGNLEAWEVF